MLESMFLATVLAFLSALIHALGLLGLLYWQTRQWPDLEANFRPRRNLPTFLLLFGVILTLHWIEVSLWAGVYFWRHWLPSWESSLYFSATSYSATGYGDILLPRAWRLVGVMESITVVLLLGWSAGFFFTVVYRFFEIRIRHWQRQ
ncbi:MAG: ion channel [Acidobacteriaceae bacterium]